MDPIKVLYDTLVIGLVDDSLVFLVKSTMLGWLEISIPLQVVADATFQLGEAINGEESE